MDRNEMLTYVNNPNKSIEYVINKMYEASNGDIEITDPTNPFVMLLESSAINASNSIIEPINMLRKIYPNLAETKEDLSIHISDNELSKISATPSFGSFIFYINLTDFKNLAIDNENYKEAVIPKETKIVVADTTFTLLNDINIKLYPDNTTYVEQINDINNDLSIDELGILNSGVITDKIGNKWIIFETLVKQINIINTTMPIITADTFNKSLPLKDKYIYSVCEYMNSYTNNKYAKLKVMMSDTYYNPNIPSIMVKVLKDNVKYKVPDVYLINGSVSGTMRIRQYETKGKIYLPLDKYPTSEFKLVYPTNSITDKEAAIKNITIQIQSRLPVEGGNDGLSFQELKNSIIYNSKNYNNLPITRHNLQAEAEKYGFEIFKAEDDLLNRSYFASKSLPSIANDLILSEPDIYFNKVNLVLGNTVNASSITLNENYSIIKSGTVFKEENNVITIVNDEELDYINKMDNVLKSEYLYNKKYFITPYYYILKPDSEIEHKTILNVYNLDAPKLSNFKILARNNNMNIKVNTDKYTIVKKGDMYIIKTTLKYNELFSNINPNNIKAQLSIPLEGKENEVHFFSTYDKNENGFTFGIISTLYINDNDSIELINGTSMLTSKFIKLISEAKLYIYTTDKSIYDNTNYLRNSIMDTENTNITVLNLEEIKIQFGERLEYLWTNIYNGFTNRKYKVYETDIYKRYDEDVYEVLNEDGDTVITDDDGNVIYNILHKKGEIVYDENNDPIIEHKKGELILDENGYPTIDKYFGIIKYLDIMMIDYIYYVPANNIYLNYNKLLLETINRWLTIDMKLLNEKTLENTNIYFKSYYDTNDVKITLNNKIYVNKYVVKPEIILYTNLTKISIPMEILRKKIGKIIKKHLLDIEFNIDTVKEEILKLYPNEIIGCKISNITGSDIDRFKINDLTKRLTLNKKLSVTPGNELLVEYDIDIKIYTI